MDDADVAVLQSDSLEELLKTPACDALSFSQKEGRILKLWDLEDELRLEASVVESQGDIYDNVPVDVSDDELDEQIKLAERAALEARAAFVLRSRIIQHVLITDPILKAVHVGGDGGPLERKMLALINERDVLAMVNSKLSLDIQEVTARVGEAERENIGLVAANQPLAADLLALAENMKEQPVESIEDAALRQQLIMLDHEVANSRRNWRLMKGIVSAVVAGSGVDWARNATLTELVLDDE